MAALARVTSRAISGGPQPGLLAELVGQIKFRGPITFGDYMRTCLTHPIHGYYMNRDVFGRRGDFITGPEISQVYGELVGVWCVAMWEQMGEPEAVRIVEAGPGRGTLMADLLRVVSRHERLSRAASVHLIEVSPWMRASQRELLCGAESARGSSEGGVVAHARTRDGQMPISWHDSLRDMLDAHYGPDDDAAGGGGGDDGADGGDGRGGSSRTAQPDEGNAASTEQQPLPQQQPPPPPSIFLAHEFLDALPVHKFRRAPARFGSAPGQWREVLIDVTDEELEFEPSAPPLVDTAASDPLATCADGAPSAGGASPLRLRFVLAPGPTPALAAYGHLLPPTEPARKDGAAAAFVLRANSLAAARALTGAPPPAAGAEQQLSAGAEQPSTGAEQASAVTAQEAAAQTGVEFEVCPLGLAFVAEVAREISAHRGAALLIDYGRAEGPVADSARAIIEHRFVELLRSPGEADLSALVDFGAMRDAAQSVPGVSVGAIGTQRELLGGMGLEARVNALLKRASPEQARALIAAAQRLVAVPGMGEEYKALAFADSATGVPVGFNEG
jgi:NADH dehydrogenase [ubiquinone] 1 alpha subcomplex assembly factor 7